MPLIKTIELPAGMGQHFFFDCGGGDALAFFWFPDAPEPASRGVGARRPPRPGQPDQRHRLDEPRGLRRAARADRRVPGPAARPPAWTAPRWPTTTTASGASPTSSTPGCSCGRSTSRIPTASCSSSPAGPGALGPRRRAHAAGPGASDAAVGLSRPMPRLRQVPRAEADGPIVTVMYDFLFEDRDPVAEPGTSDGTPGDWWTVFALVPDVLEHAVQGFGLYQSPKRLLDPRAARAGPGPGGWAAGSQFVFSQHCKSLRASAWRTRRSPPCPTGRRPTCFDADRAAGAGLHRLPGPRPRPGARRAVRRRCGRPERRGDPRAHLHHRACTCSTP